MQIILAILVFISMSFFVYGAMGAGYRRRMFRARLEALDVTGAGMSLDDMEMSRSFVERVLMPLFARVGKRLSAHTPKGSFERQRGRLQRAGYAKADPITFLGIKCVAALGGLGLSALCVALCKMKLESVLPHLAICAYVGFKAPEMYLVSRTKRRKEAIGAGLPDLLDLLCVSVEAGLGFDQALMRSTEKMSGPISDEFKRVLQEIRMGLKRSEALRALADRVQQADLTAFCATLIQADQLGVSISEVLRVQSESMRQKRRQRAQEAAMKAPIKLLFPLVAFIFPTIFVVLLGPAGIKVYEVFSKM
jgi:tight adherence protein C